MIKKSSTSKVQEELTLGLEKSSKLSSLAPPLGRIPKNELGNLPGTSRIYNKTNAAVADNFQVNRNPIPPNQISEAE